MPDIFVSPSSVTSDQTKSNKAPTHKKEKRNQLLGKSFSSYLFMPDDIRFETQSTGETIILLLRRHWITNLIWIFISILLIISPFIILPVIVISIPVISNISASLAGTIVLGWYLITFTYIYVNFILWYFNVSIVTNERIIDIDFINLLNKKFAETRIVKIEDVTMKTGGFIRSFFDYGNVYVQTAAKEAMFEFLSVPHPEKVVRLINELMGKSEEEGGRHP